VSHILLSLPVELIELRRNYLFTVMRVCDIDHALEELVTENISPQRPVVPKGTPGYFSIQSAQGWPDDLGRTCANHGCRSEVNNKETMIADSIPYRHYTRMCHLEVACCPDRIDWLAAPEKCSTEPFTGKVTYHFPHSQTMKIRELPTEFRPVDILVCIET
jgi:hypothetical protein